MRGLDTNVLLRLLVDDDAEQAEVSRQLVAREAQRSLRGLLVCNIVLVELVWVLRKTLRLPRAQIVATLERVLATEGFRFENEDAVKGAVGLVRDTGVDFADALIGILNAADGCATTWTFDRRAAELAEFTLVTPSGSA